MKRKAKIYYAALDDFWRKEQKLEWLRENPIGKIAFETITPDAKHNWINQTDNDWDSLVPVRVKGSNLEQGQIHLKSSLGISTNRDEWIYDIDKSNLLEKITNFVGELNTHIQRSDDQTESDPKIKWSRDLRTKAVSMVDAITVDDKKIAKISYRPFIDFHSYLDRTLIDRLTDQHLSFRGNEIQSKNKFILYTDANSGKPFMVMASRVISDLHFVGAGAGTMILPLTYSDNSSSHDNITDWAVEEFGRRGASGLSKEDIFHYVYAVLHYPAYREKYAQNLKREFPRIPVYEKAREWVRMGEELMELHLNYETVEQFPLAEKEIEPKPRKAETRPVGSVSLPQSRQEVTEENTLATARVSAFVAKSITKLRADKMNGVIEIDSLTRLEGVPAIAWEYKLGNRSALEWVLDQYKERKPKDPTIAEKFNTYRFADYKDHVIDLLKRVCTVSVKTMEIVNSMPKDGS